MSAEATTMTMAAALNASLRASMERDSQVLLMGEDIGKLGGVFRITEGLQKDFGEHRVIDTPLAESGIVGTAIGLAVSGYRPVVEIQFDAFVYPAYDQIVTQLAKLHSRTGGTQPLPVTIRIPYGGGIGSPEHHSESPEAVFGHHAGLRLMTASDPHSAYWVMQEAIRSDDPVIVFEPKRRYWMRGEVDTEAAEPLGAARILAEGTDVTLVTYGPLTPVAQTVVTQAAELGISVELVDLLSLNPLGLDLLEESVKRTGRLVIGHEAPTFLGMGAELSARMVERAFYHLEAPIARVGGFHLPYPPSRMEEHYLPDLDRLLDAVEDVMTH
ncbi:alpha-ketoacid dehydrogenase subunit beta [Nesterenkonia alkaliphila]|nr:alpha-ketoacid dehydrogenase subunit beta [Nesterenkonia alkaliphila]GFZ93649.1 2-oxoisovalerate dehydrogenase subunit beta [Nesterenkonia alkaliphila]